MGRSEILRHRLKYAANDIKNYDRFSYYTLLDVNFNGKIRSIEFKVDTGSPCTVIGVDLLKKANINLTEEIEKTGMQDKLVDASGGDVRITPCVVQCLKLTEEILLNNVLVYISPDIERRAVLGMDILSLFDFQYQWEVNSMLGTFWINNYVKRMEFINRMLADKELGVLDSKQMFLLDDRKKEFGALDEGV